CPSLNDLDRINHAEFGGVTEFMKTLLRNHYESCGFIVCKLRVGKDVKYHPLAYSHQITENCKLFAPTRHYHGNHDGEAKEEIESDWYHEIYSWNTLEKTNIRMRRESFKDYLGKK